MAYGGIPGTIRGYKLAGRTSNLKDKREMTTFIAVALLGTGLGFAQGANPQVTMTIANRGEMVIELYPQDAPKTVEQFLRLVNNGFYNGVLFHRVENYPRPFIIVTGDPLTKTLPLTDPKIGTGGSGNKLPFEANKRTFQNGTVGLARDQRDKNSGDSQFFICNGAHSFLDGSYVAFGQVVRGLDVIPKVELGDKVTSIRQTR